MIEKTNMHFLRLEDQIKECRMTIVGLLDERKELHQKMEDLERNKQLIESQLQETRIKFDNAEKILRPRKIARVSCISK